ncbi:MAG: MFS transporter [Treponema sp.]|nr:MFS transporter [Treponema sp.]
MHSFNVKNLYIYKFISNCLPIYAFYTILFIERGQSLTNVAILIAIWSVFAIIFEIPSGILADRWNRRNMLALASILQGICFLMWFFSHSFLMFAAGFVFWALAGAFTSGTEEGLIYDNLKSDNREEDFAAVYGKARFFEHAGSIAGIASAGIIASFINIDVIALISAAICFINVIFVMQLREKNFYSERLSDENEEKAASFIETFKESARFIKGNKAALSFILFLALFASLGAYLDEFDALIINDFDLNSVWVSVILTVRFVFIALGDILAPIVQKKFRSARQIFIIFVLSCILLAVFSLIWNQFALLIFGLSVMLMAITEILFVDALQNEIKEEGRSTVMSFYGAAQNIVMICFSLMYGLLAKVFTLSQVYVIISIYGIIGGVFFCYAQKKASIN